MKFRRFFTLLLMALFLLPTTAQARDMQMYVSGTYLTRNIESVDGFDMVPLLDISGELGFHSWFDGTTAIIYNDEIKFTFTMHSPAVYDQYGREYGLDIVPQIINGKFMIPAKFFVDHLNMTYTWDYVTDTVFLNSDYTYQWLIGTKEYTQAKNKQNIIGAWIYEQDTAWNPHNITLEFYTDGTCFYETWRTRAYGNYHFTDATHIAVDFAFYYKNNQDPDYVFDQRQTNYYFLEENTLTETGFITSDGKTYKTNIPLKNNRVTLYTPDYNNIVVDKDEVSYWTQHGWYAYPVCYIYKLDGSRRVVAESEADSWKTSGWLTSPYVRMYELPFGAEEYVSIEDVSSYESMGWVSEVTIQKNASYTIDQAQQIASEYCMTHLPVSDSEIRQSAQYWGISESSIRATLYDAALIDYHAHAYLFSVEATEYFYVISVNKVSGKATYHYSGQDYWPGCIVF